MKDTLVSPDGSNKIGNVGSTFFNKNLKIGRHVLTLKLIAHP